ncbi:hypothetical protein ABZ871_39360 [Streptomyces populi]
MRTDPFRELDHPARHPRDPETRSRLSADHRAGVPAPRVPIAGRAAPRGIGVRDAGARELGLES